MLSFQFRAVPYVTTYRSLIVLAATALAGFAFACGPRCESGWHPTPTTCGIPDASIPPALDVPDVTDVSSAEDALDVPDVIDTDVPDAADASTDDASDAFAADAPDVTDASAGIAPNVLATDWSVGSVTEPLPDRALLRHLPGGGVGGPVVTSNNPEAFDADGLLYGTRPSPTRGGTAMPLSGDFGAYIHHNNRASSVRYVSLVLLNATTGGVLVNANGSGYTSDETGGTGLGISPDYRVSEDWITQRPATRLASTVLAPGVAVIAFQKPVGIGAEIDARFAIHSSGNVHVLIVASADPALAGVLAAAATDAPGNVLTSGNPPPPYGREAGVYANDTWRGTIAAQVPTAGHRVGFMVNTATGTGLSQVQAFPALTHFTESARESVGMYGNVYDLTVTLVHDGDGSATRHVRLSFASYVSAMLSRYWDGAALLDGVTIALQNTGTRRVQVLREVSVDPGAPVTITLRAMVPGLVTIPQAVFLESF